MNEATNVPKARSPSLPRNLQSATARCYSHSIRRKRALLERIRVDLVNWLKPNDAGLTIDLRERLANIDWRLGISPPRRGPEPPMPERSATPESAETIQS